MIRPPRTISRLSMQIWYKMRNGREQIADTVYKHYESNMKEGMLIDFATSRNMVISFTRFPHKNTQKRMMEYLSTK